MPSLVLQLSYILYDRIPMRIESDLCVAYAFRSVQCQFEAMLERRHSKQWRIEVDIQYSFDSFFLLRIMPASNGTSVTNCNLTYLSHHISSQYGQSKSECQLASNSCRVTWLQHLMWTLALCVQFGIVSVWFRIPCCGTDSLHHMQCIMHISLDEKEEQRFF